MNRFRLVAALLVVGLISGYAVSRIQPVMYRSSAIIQRVPPRVAYAPGTVGQAVIHQVGAVVQLRSSFDIVASRSRLERLILELNLYQREREKMIMEDVVALMRNRLSFDVHAGDVFTISFTGTDPGTAQTVTDRIAQLFVDESVKQPMRVAEGTLSFLQARIDETGQRLEALAAKGAVSRPRVVEIEVVEAAYRNLLTRREETLAMRDIEQRQIGEQFVMLDGPRMPERPIGPNRLRFTLIGGAVGIGVAGLISLGFFVGRIIRGRRQKLSAATA